MKSQSLLPTKIDGRDIVKTIKQSDPLDLAIWKLMSDGKKRTREDVVTALREYGFRREDVDDRMATLYCSSNRRWFDAQGRNKNTTYQLRKNRLERPFARGGIEFESISNIRDILVIDEEAKRLFEENDVQQQYTGLQAKQNQTNEEVMSNETKPSAPPMPDDESAAPAIDHSQLGAHNWFGAAALQPYSQSPQHSPSGAGMLTPEDAEKFSKPLENAAVDPYKGDPLDPRQSRGIEVVKRTLTANVDTPRPTTQAEPTDFDQADRDDQPMDPLLETTPNRSLGEADILSNGMPAISTPASRALASSLLEKGAAATWADIGQGAKFQVVQTYRKDDLETMILRIFVQSERVFANRDLGDLLVGHPTTAIDYRVRKFLAAGLLKRIESGEGSDRRVHYHFNSDGRYTKPGQEVLDRMNGIAKEGAEHINSINVELGKYAMIPGGADPKLASIAGISDSLTPFDADLFILGLPRSRMDSGMEWFGRLVGIYGRDVSKIEDAMQALVDKEQLTCSQLARARLEFKSWVDVENKEGAVTTEDNKFGVLSQVSDKPADTSDIDRSVGLSELRPGNSADSVELEQLIQNAKRRTEAQISRNLHEALEAVFSDSDLINRYFDDLVNSRDPAVRKNTLVKLVTRVDPNSPVLELVKLANAALMAYEYFGTKDAGLELALAATGADNPPASAMMSYHEWADLKSAPAIDQISVAYGTKPVIVVRGMVLSADEAREIKEFVEGISALHNSAGVPTVLKKAKIEIQGRDYTFEEIEDIGIELLSIFN